MGRGILESDVLVDSPKVGTSRGLFSTFQSGSQHEAEAKIHMMASRANVSISKPSCEFDRIECLRFWMLHSWNDIVTADIFLYHQGLASGRDSQF